VETLQRLTKICRDVVEDYVVDAILQPLARTISLD
jgi:hypothetical protein